VSTFKVLDLFSSEVSEVELAFFLVIDLWLTEITLKCVNKINHKDPWKNHGNDLSESPLLFGDPVGKQVFIG